MCELAARNGHLDVLMFAREHDCPWTIDVCQGAAQFGYLEMLK
jgi:hypothetical protein